MSATTHVNTTHGKNMMPATRTPGSQPYLPLTNPLLDFLFPVCLSFPVGKLTTAAPEHRPVCSPGWMPLPTRCGQSKKRRVLLVPQALRGRGATVPPNESGVLCGPNGGFHLFFHSCVHSFIKCCLDIFPLLRIKHVYCKNFKHNENLKLLQVFS